MTRIRCTTFIDDGRDRCKRCGRTATIASTTNGGAHVQVLYNLCPRCHQSKLRAECRAGDALFWNTTKGRNGWLPLAALFSEGA